MRSKTSQIFGVAGDALLRYAVVLLLILPLLFLQSSCGGDGSGEDDSNNGSSTADELQFILDNTFCKDYLQDDLIKSIIDLLFVVDDSGSMAGDQTRLKNGFQALMAHFWDNNKLADYHLGIVTTDMYNPDKNGKLQGDPIYITKADGKDGIDKFEQHLQPGDQGHGHEQPLKAMEGMFNLDKPGAFNEGFIRDEADFGVIFVSDENDESPETIEYYRDFLEAEKPNSKIYAHSITIRPGDFTTYPSCKNNGEDEEAIKTMAFVDEFQGKKLSICVDDWNDILDEIGESFSFEACFLTERKDLDPNTVAVRIDGKKVDKKEYYVVQEKDGKLKICQEKDVFEVLKKKIEICAVKEGVMEV